MLAHAPYHSPIDYKNLLIVHKTAKECVDIVNEWLPTIEELYQEEQQKYLDHRSEARAAAAMQRIYLGEHIAENEQRDLLNVFVSTAPYQQALKTQQSRIFIGRKGSGKTANLYKVADELQKDPRNHVCIIKPIDYELEGVVDVLNSNLTEAVQGYLLESLWKFLIYSELAISVYNQIESKPVHYRYSAEETEFLDFANTKLDLIEPDFASRMENAINLLRDLDKVKQSGQQKLRVSELLHSDLLSKLREHLGKVLEQKRRVCILVDNLDKTWKYRDDLSALARFLLGLLNISPVIPHEFQKRGQMWRPVNLSLLIFLRSDIFSYVISVANEADKLTFSRINWEDPKILQKVIEERFVSSLEYKFTPKEVWEDFFDPTVKGVPTKDYLVDRVMPRPRDIIYLCKAALGHAINHNHTRITKEDIVQAEKNYSQQTYYTLLAETEAQIPDIEAIVVEFAGAPEIVTRIQIEDFIERAKVTTTNSDRIISLLCDSLFLGIETDVDDFNFIYDEGRKDVLQSLARTTSERTGMERYKIAIPFHSFLSIRTNDTVD
jgi:Cdc6-like AAA superfamily ATPase